MAKRGRNSKKRRSYAKRGGGKKKTPRTVQGVWRAQPLLVKGGMALTAIEIGTSSANKYGTSISTAVKAKDLDGALRIAKENATDLNNYKPLAYGVIAHYVAKALKVKGL